MNEDEYAQFLADNKPFLIEQSKMVQDIIKRMATSSLEIKKIGFTTWSALVGVGINQKNSALFWLAIASLAVFGLLDVYYLHLERNFRDNFNWLADIICGDRAKIRETLAIKPTGNFVKPLSRSASSAGRPSGFGFNQKRWMLLKNYLSAIKSWANFPYLVVFVLTFILLASDISGLPESQQTP
jgi:hypothetical protein